MPVDFSEFLKRAKQTFSAPAPARPLFDAGQVDAARRYPTTPWPIDPGRSNVPLFTDTALKGPYEEDIRDRMARERMGVARRFAADAQARAATGSGRAPPPGAPVPGDYNSDKGYVYPETAELAGSEGEVMAMNTQIDALERQLAALKSRRDAMQRGPKRPEAGGLGERVAAVSAGLRKGK